jgi:hypothetical protein
MVETSTVRHSSAYRRALVAVLAGGALALAACSSSGSSSTPSSSPSAPASTSGTSTSPAPVASGGSSGSAATTGDIVVGGVQDGNYAGIDQGFDARIARFNAAGGLGGRKIKLTGVLNDGGSPSANLADVQTLALKDNVFAVVPYSSQAWSASSSALLAKQNIPYIGWAISPTACIGDTAFPVSGCAATPNYTTIQGEKQLPTAIGKPAAQIKFAVIGTDNAGGAAGTKTVAFAAKKAGLDVVYAQAPVPQGGTTDYSAYTQAILASGTNALEIALDFPTGVSFTGALRQAGYTGAIINPTAYVPGLLTSQKQLALALQGSYVTANFPPQEGGSAVVKQALADLKAAGQPQVLSLGTEIGWFSADEFIQELQATAKAGAVTSANFVKTIRAGFTYNTGAGGLNGLIFPAGQSQPASCAGFMLVKPNGTYSVAAPYSCDPSTIIKVG